MSGAIASYLACTQYARRVRGVIQSDEKLATEARMYMEGLGFMPVSKNVLYGSHFKSIAAAGPIVGPIAISHRLIAPRTRTILLFFSFFYLVLVAGASSGPLGAVWAHPHVPSGIIVLAVMGVLTYTSGEFNEGVGGGQRCPSNRVKPDHRRADGDALARARDGSCVPGGARNGVNAKGVTAH